MSDWSNPNLLGKCTCADSLWNRWAKEAGEAGIDAELVRLGSAVIQNAAKCGWSYERKVECGWLDEGAEMMYLALVAPDRTRCRWKYLLDTNGGEYHRRNRQDVALATDAILGYANEEMAIEN